MLISAQHRFVFIASAKSASTSIEKVLRPFSDIAITDRLKHMPAESVIRNFRFYFNSFGRLGHRQFFKFGVVRDPVEWVISWYNYRSRDKLRGNPRYTGDISFDQFWGRWEEQRLGTPTRCFRGRKGECLMDYLIRFEELTEGFERVIRALGLEGTSALPLENKSKMSLVDRDRLDTALVNDMKEFFKDDYFFIDEFASGERPVTRRRGNRAGVR